MENVYAFAELFHPAGPRVRLPFPAPPEQPEFYKNAFAAVADALAAGWLTLAPGLTEGEQRETVGYVAVGEQERNGNVTPYLLLYGATEGLNNFSFLKRYLNHPEDVAAFESASGMTLSKLAVYVGDNKPERGKSSKIDAFIHRVPRPFDVVYKPNPKFSQKAADEAKKTGEMYSVPARVFVRWGNESPAKAAAPEGKGGLPPQAPTVDVMNVEMKRIGWKWSDVTGAINRNDGTHFGPATRYNEIASGMLAGVYAYMTTLPTAEKTRPAGELSEQFVLHAERIDGCKSENELQIALDLVRIAKGLTPEEKTELEKHVAPKLNSLRAKR